MKRICYISILLCIALLHIEAQVLRVDFYKSTNDTAKMTSVNWGILSKFITFPDGTKMLTAAGFSDTSKYVEKPDSLIGAGYATRTMLQADSNYARALFARDTTYRKAQEDAIRLDTIYARAIFALDTTYKAAQLLLRIKYADSTNSPGYVTRTQFRADSVYARAIFALDTTYKAAQLLTRIPYSDTTSALVKQWIFVRDSLYRAAQEALKVTKVDSAAMPGYVTRTSFANDSTYARAIFALDTTYKAAQLLTRIKYSDTTSTVAMQWELDGKIAKSDTSAFPQIIPARDGQQGWFKRNATAPQSGTVSLATATDSVLIAGGLGIGSITSFLHKLAIGDIDSTGGFHAVRTDKNKNCLTLAQATDTSSVRFFSTASGKWQFRMINNLGANQIFIDSTGRITMGAEAKDGTALTMYSPTAGDFIQISSNSNYGGLYGFGDINLAISSSGSGGYLTFLAADVERMRINPAGNIGIGTTTPLHKQSTVSAIATNLYAFNFVDSDINTNRTTVAQSTDTSSVNLNFTSTGEPIFSLIGKTGTVNFRSDSSGAIFNGLVDFQGTNSATVTAGAGDSIQVSVTGVTITSQIVATYATTTALIDIPTGIRNRQTGKFTIGATNGKDVTYWIAKK